MKDRRDDVDVLSDSNHYCYHIYYYKPDAVFLDTEDLQGRGTKRLLPARVRCRVDVDGRHNHL